MATFKTTKKHHKHINNPFPTKPKTLPFIKGALVFDSHALPPHRIYDIGLDFHLNWSSDNGGSLSIHHNSHPTRSIWSTVPGRAFVSAGAADTEVEESRGSFLIKDGEIHLLCNHQTIEEIRIIQQESSLLIKGRIFSVKEKKKRNQESFESGSFEVVEKGQVAFYAKYWMVFDQRNCNQVGFRLRFGKPSFGQKQKQKLKLSPKSYGYKGFGRKVGRIRRVRVVGWCGCFSRKRVVVSASQEDENAAMKNAILPDFNRVCVTYSSEKNERFFGFGEQFSHMDFKGRKVPIFVQEQGIGRGDQPITFAANLVSFRAGGDDSTTYAPSPFYMTSKMKSLYLEGYNYSVFDLTKDDCVQIQIHGDTIEGRILNGNSPVELIEHFTETIGRPEKLPDWIISGAVVGMQGGTDKVRSILDELRAKDTPISQ